MQRLTSFWRDEHGAVAIEYAVIATLISVVIVASARQIGSNIQNLFYAQVAGNLT